MEMQALFPIDPKRMYCTGGSLGADCTGNLAKDMPEVWAAVFAFSQGGPLFSRRNRRLPFISAQAYNYELSVLRRSARRFRQGGYYDPAIHHLMCYPGVGHCGMSRDIWPFVLDFFDRHRRDSRR